MNLLKKLARTLLKIIGIPVLALACRVTYLLYLAAPLYALALVVLGVRAVIGSAAPWEPSVLAALLWGYIGLALVTVAVITIFEFRHCCVGLGSFGSHLRHKDRTRREVLALGLLWPYSWRRVTNSYAGSLQWDDIVLEPALYLAEARLVGHRVDTIDLAAGTHETTHLR